MEYILANLLPITLATIAGLLFGAAWYSAFSGPWMRAAGVTRAGIQGAGGRRSVILVAFIAQ